MSLFPPVTNRMRPAQFPPPGGSHSFSVLAAGGYPTVNANTRLTRVNDLPPSSTHLSDNTGVLDQDVKVVV